MTEPHEIFTPDLGEEVIHVTPNCFLTSDLALRFSPVVDTVLSQWDETKVPRKPEISDVVGRQPNWLS